jgi:hypothetical protein
MRHFGFGIRCKIGGPDAWTSRRIEKIRTPRFAYLYLFEDLEHEDIEAQLLFDGVVEMSHCDVDEGKKYNSHLESEIRVTCHPSNKLQPYTSYNPILLEIWRHET